MSVLEAVVIFAVVVIEVVVNVDEEVYLGSGVGLIVYLGTFGGAIGVGP